MNVPFRAPQSSIRSSGRASGKELLNHSALTMSRKRNVSIGVGRGQPKVHKQRHCSACGEPGHGINSPKCPKTNEALELKRSSSEPVELENSSI